MAKMCQTRHKTLNMVECSRCYAIGARSLMDRTEASDAFDAGSIPVGRSNVVV